MYGWEVAALRKCLVLCFIKPSSTIVVNHVVCEQVMKFLRLSAVIHPNNSVLCALHVIVSHLAEGNRFPNRSVQTS